MALLFPAAHAGIDWCAGFKSRDKELSKLNRDNRTGARFVDKLVEVKRFGGGPALVMVHIEVQSHPDGDFARRMFTYYYRLLDRYGADVVSLALLADSDTAWRSGAFQTELWKRVENPSHTLLRRRNAIYCVVPPSNSAAIRRRDALHLAFRRSHLGARWFFNTLLGMPTSIRFPSGEAAGFSGPGGPTRCKQ